MYAGRRRGSGGRLLARGPLRVDSPEAVLEGFRATSRPAMPITRPRGTSASSSRPPKAPRWKISGSPPEPSKSITSPITRSWSPAVWIVVNVAAQDGQRVADDHEAGRVDDGVALRERCAALGERDRDVGLAAVQDVHRELLRLRHLLQRPGAVRERDQDQQRVERHRRERVERHPGLRLSPKRAVTTVTPVANAPDDVPEVESGGRIPVLIRLTPSTRPAGRQTWADATDRTTRRAAAGRGRARAARARRVPRSCRASVGTNELARATGINASTVSRIAGDARCRAATSSTCRQRPLPAGAAPAAARQLTRSPGSTCGRSPARTWTQLARRRPARPPRSRSPVSDDAVTVDFVA